MNEDVSLLKCLQCLLLWLPLERHHLRLVSLPLLLDAPRPLLCLNASPAPHLLERLVEALPLPLSLLHLLLIFEDLLGGELKDVGLGQSVLADGSQEVLVGIQNARLL